MTRVALLTSSLTEAAAVTGDVLGTYRALKARGHDVRIFADTWQLARPRVRHFSRLEPFLRGRDALLIYHHRADWEDGCRALEQARCKRVFKYHDAPPEDAGRGHLAALARAGCDRYLARSAHAARQLLDGGAPPSAVAVVPPFPKVERLEALEADLRVLDRYRDGRINVLTVGRLTPHKGHAALLEAFAVYHHACDQSSRLLIVGRPEPRSAAFARALQDRVHALGLAGTVVLTGEVSDSTLKACYLAADVFVLAGGDEGFAMPLVEAMALKLPVVALGRAAVPETVGEAGLVWETADPYLLAASLHCLAGDEDARAALGVLGWQRYQRYFASDKVAERFLTALDGLL
jgi:glycosyltransferase involved in cell wall biosynthesis